MKCTLIVTLFVAITTLLGDSLDELPVAKVTVKLHDETRKPVPDAKVTFVFASARDDKEALVVNTTDKDGLSVGSGFSAGSLSGFADKAGFYRTAFEKKQFESSIEGKWQPWNPVLEVVLRRIVNPIPMYAKKIATEIPVISKPVGFDLMEGDWVMPFGKGKTEDFIFTLNRRFVNAKNYDSKLEIRMSQVGDGLQAWDNEADYFPVLKLPRIAPDNGYVQPLVFANKWLPGSFVDRDVKVQRNYLLRVRTVLGSRNEVVSALYGKIDGDIRFSPIGSNTASLMLTYYLNPNLNDRNLEFDPKKNLFRDLKPRQRVSAP